MSKIPRGWSQTTLESVCDVVRGITFPASAKESAAADDNVCCLRTANVQREIDWDDVYFVSRDFVKRDEQFVRLGDILMSMANSYELVGKVAVVRSLPFATAYGAFLSAVRPTGAVLGQYLFHFLRSDVVQRTIREGSSQTTNIANISISTLSKIAVPLAPLAEQKRIADKLDSLLSRVDSCRERLDRVPAILSRFRQSVLAAAASGKLTEDWRDENVSGCGTDVVARDAESKKTLLEKTPSLKKKKSSLESDIDTEFVFEIPSSWCFTSWGVASEWITYGFTRPMPHVESGIKLVTAKDVQRFLVDLSKTHETSQEAFASLSEKDKPSVGDLLLTKDGTIGRAALVRDNIPFCINQSVAVAWLRSTCMNKAYLEIVANAEFTQAFIREKSQGMAIQHLSIIDFAKCPLPVPPIEEQAEISRRVETLFAFADSLEHRYFSTRHYVDRLPSALLAKAFRGELVPQDPNDEPANVLLERIRKPKDENGDESKKKGRSKMTRITRKSNSQIRQLTAVLQENGGVMTPEKLLDAAGYTDESIEDFYLALKKSIAEGAIQDPRDHDNQIALVQAQT